MTNGGRQTLGPSLSERARELVLDAEVERETLERRKAELLTEREAEVAKVREEYRGKLDEIERDLDLATRLRKALDPEGAKRDAAAKAAAKRQRKAPAKPGAPSQNWRPRPEVFDRVFQALSEGHETVNDIAATEGVNVSTSTVKLALDHARDEGMVRLAGTVPGKSGAKLYRLTPEGEESVAQRTNGGNIVAHA